MARLGKADLAQMGEDYFESLEPKRLVEVTKNLYELAVEQLEKLEESSRTSSRPPSSDNPYRPSSSVDSGEESLIWRGPPGTHDVELGIGVLEQLRQGQAAEIPQFDKALQGGAGRSRVP